MIVTKKDILDSLNEGFYKEYPLEDIGLWYGDSDYKVRGGEMVYMTPDEFLSKAKPLEMTDETRSNINDLIAHVSNGGKLDPLTLYSLDKSDVRNSDGRHRAIMAMQIGIRKLPVLDFTKSNGDVDLEVVSELFSISPECEDPSFYISMAKDNFGEPMMEKKNDMYSVKVNPKYKDLFFVFEVINDMYNNKEFESLFSESEFVCEECLELKIEDRLNEKLDVLSDMVELNESITYHLDNNIPLIENVYRPGSYKHMDLIREAREMWERGSLNLDGFDSFLFENTSLGTFGEYNGLKVPLDLPILAEQGSDTSWENGEGEKITLQDILVMTKDIPKKDYPTDKLADVVLGWDGNPEELDRVEQVEVSEQYPILIMVNEVGEIQWILDGNHRAQRALGSNMKTIPAKLIKPSDLDAKAKKVLLGIVDGIDEVEYKGRDVKLNKPKRGGSKKFYVYVRKPNGGIKKVSFGDTTGLSVKLNDPKARKSFAARHDCANKKDRTKASYWSCRLPRYASLLGLKSNFSGYW